MEMFYVGGEIMEIW